MNKISYLQTIKRDWHVIALLAGIAIVASLGVSLLQPFKYEARAKVLVIQNQVSHLDAYTATKSAEKIGKNLSEVVESTSFYNDVVALYPAIKDEFSVDPIDLRKEWKQDVNAEIIPETGILDVRAYNEDRQTVADLVNTMTYVLVNKSEKYHGGGLTVSIQVIDDVVVSRYPVRPNIFVNTALAFMLGIVAGSVFVVLNQIRRTAKQENEVSEDVFVADAAQRKVATSSFDLAPSLNSYSNEDTRNWKIIE
jgi:capsular polysaccharide biosynthesis protein